MLPLQFHPVLKCIRWGGRRLGTVLGKPIGDANDYAESWEIADCGVDQSTVAEGPFEGWTLSRLVAAEPTALRERSRPVAFSALDQVSRLQRSPVGAGASQRRAGAADGCGENGKTEAWLILEARPDSRVYAGLKPDVDRQSLERHLDAGTVEECLHSFPARAGDCVFVPAGTVHALGEGILLAETQQSSNVTFRLFDWGRVGPDGKPRELHREESLACIDFERGPVNPVVPRVVANGSAQVEELVQSKYFALRRHTFSQPVTIEPNRKFRILIPLAGPMDVGSDRYQKQLRLGNTLLVPASTPSLTLSPSGTASLLVIE